MDQLRTEPWLTEEANRILQKIIDNGKDLRIFEYGMGASTIWFLKQKNVKVLHSVEHDTQWWDEITKQAKSFLAKPQDGMLMRREQSYHDAIAEAAKIGDKYDIILVDGRNRAACIQSALPYLAKNGVLILDNSEREYYAPGKNLMNSFQRIETYQHEPDKYGFTYTGWTTTFFFKNGIPKTLSLIK
jgi:predicted O-methyltransferase YrrM